MEIKKVEKFEFNGVLYDTENEAKIAAGVEAITHLTARFKWLGVLNCREELIERRLELKVAAEAAEILIKEVKARKPAPEAVQADWTDEDWPAKGWKKLKKKPYVKEPEDGFEGVEAYRMEEAGSVQHLTVEDGIVSDRIMRKGETYIMETEEVKNKLEFMALLKIRNCKLEKEYRDLTGAESKRFEELRKILGV